MGGESNGRSNFRQVADRVSQPKRCFAPHSMPWRKRDGFGIPEGGRNPRGSPSSSLNVPARRGSSMECGAASSWALK